ncbi:FimD/PapC C-terminal domain-containing protein, partial [Agrobacterium tumefaciens]|uniref:FimD/PapC C-terminal domain-containing protein n=1 Tax=Agrobacterium tumefaciens TaxID=358 RepID=UPI003B9ECA54
QPDVQVLSQHREIGRTNSRGYLLVPDLNSYQRNAIGIKPVDLPADMQIETDAMEVVPQAQSGVLARFGVKRFQAASVHIQGPDGRDIPVGTRVRHVESGAETIVGYDGLTFVDNLRARNRLELTGDAIRCTVDFDYAPAANGSLPLIGPLRCAPSTGARP